MDTAITRAEHEEFRKRLEEAHQRLADEDKRQNQRLDALEQKIEDLSDLTASMAEMSANVKNMCEVLQKQEIRLRAIEARDGEMWRKVIGYVLTSIVGIVLGFVFTQIGM